MRIWLVLKRNYGDFDVALDEAVEARYSKEAAKSRVDELNSNLTDDEKDSCVKYIVGDSIKLL